MAMLADDFVVGTRNIEKEGHVGLSHGYACDQTAVGTTNGAGGRNVQILILAADETVVHALPGFWHAQDLLPELRLGLDLHRLYTDEVGTEAGKRAMFEAMHRSHLRRFGPGATERGAWQGFDAVHELERASRETRDTVLLVADGPRKLKTIPQLVHDRLLTRPFQKLADFDLESFVDYGRPFYDNNQGLDRGRNFPRAAHVNEQRAREQEKAERAAAKDAAKAAKVRKARPAETEAPEQSGARPDWQPAGQGKPGANTGRPAWTEPLGPLGPGADG